MNSYVVRCQSETGDGASCYVYLIATKRRAYCSYDFGDFDNNVATFTHDEAKIVVDLLSSPAARCIYRYDSLDFVPYVQAIEDEEGRGSV